MDEDDIEYVRHYVSDRTSFKLVTDQLENKKPGEKMFLFNVTMQNHGGYTYAAENSDCNNFKFARSLQRGRTVFVAYKRSDKAFEELVRYLKKL